MNWNTKKTVKHFVIYDLLLLLQIKFSLRNILVQNYV